MLNIWKYYDSLPELVIYASSDISLPGQMPHGNMSISTLQFLAGDPFRLDIYLLCRYNRRCFLRNARLVDRPDTSTEIIFWQLDEVFLCQGILLRHRTSSHKSFKLYPGSHSGGYVIRVEAKNAVEDFEIGEASSLCSCCVYWDIQPLTVTHLAIH